MKKLLVFLTRSILPISAKRKIIRSIQWPPVGAVRFGSLRRTSPISPAWGFERGQPIDRYYIERFLARHAADIRGRVLEVGENTYTRRFGEDRVYQSEVLHVAEVGPGVTVIGDLTDGDHIPSESFDCIVLTQTLQAIFDVAAAVRTIHRILKPGGVALATVPGISKVSRYDMERWGYCWSFTTFSVEKLFEAAFQRRQVAIETHGNVLAATAFLYGLASEELRKHELDFVDPDFQVLISVRARREKTSS